MILNNIETRRICRKCNEIKDLSEFKNFQKKNKQLAMRYTCLKCFNINRKEYNKKYYDAKREILLKNAQNKREEKRKIKEICDKSTEC